MSRTRSWACSFRACIYYFWGCITHQSLCFSSKGLRLNSKVLQFASRARVCVYWLRFEGRTSRSISQAYILDSGIDSSWAAVIPTSKVFLHGHFQTHIAEGVREGVKAAGIACVATSIPTLVGVRVIPWAKANLNYTAQALIISAASIATYFIVAEKTILACSRQNSIEQYKIHDMKSE